MKAQQFCEIGGSGDSRKHRNIVRTSGHLDEEHRAGCLDDARVRVDGHERASRLAPHPAVEEVVKELVKAAIAWDEAVRAEAFGAGIRNLQAPIPHSVPAPPSERTNSSVKDQHLTLMYTCKRFAGNPKNLTSTEEFRQS